MLRRHLWPGLWKGLVFAFVASSAVIYPLAAVGVDRLPMYTVRRLTVEDGLPQNQINAIAQTPDGYLWLGTWSGLVRFDGLRFVVFNRHNTPALVNDEINALAVGPDGALWVGTHGGLLRFQNRVWTRFTNRLPEPQVWALAFDGAGTLWLESGKHVGRFPLGPFLPTADWREKFEPPVQKLVQTSVGNVAFVTPRGPIEPPDSSELAFQWPTEIPSSDYTLALASDGQGGWWLGTFKGLWHRSASSQWRQACPCPAGGSCVDLLFRDSKGTLWAGVRNAGPHRWNGSALEPCGLEPPEHPGDATAFSEDHEGGLWVGTTAGLYHLRPRLISAFTRAAGLPADDVWSVSEGLNGSIWVATHGGPAVIDHQNVLRCSGVPPGSGRRSVLVDRSGTVWMDHYNHGVLGVSTNGKTCELLVGEAVHALALDREGRLWVGTDCGAHCIRDREQIALAGMPTNEIRAIYQTRDGAVWFGTIGNGAQRWLGGELQTLSIADGLADNTVLAFHEDNDGFLWIGTDNGVSRISLAAIRDHKPLDIYNFTTDEGLLDNLINQILEDDSGFLWFSCNRGIFRIARAELNAVAVGDPDEAACAVFGTADGMPSSETNGEHQPAGCKARDGRLWFPTTQGVVVIDPRALVSKEQPPPVVIEEIKVDERTVYGEAGRSDETSWSPALLSTGTFGPPGGRSQEPQAESAMLRLPPANARVLEIHYAANSFVDSSRIRFKYKLKGHDKEWRHDRTNRRVAFYTDLRPGEYVFEVTACNSHGYWNEHPVQFSFLLAPHFYETWPFYLACGVGIAGLIAGLQSYRLRWQRRLFKVEQQQALVGERSRIARDLHDDLGASLTRIALLSEVGQKRLEQHEAPEEQVKEISEIARHVVDDMSELIWATNPKYDTLQNLIAYLREYAGRFFANTTKECHLDFPSQIPDQHLAPELRRHVLLIVKEALNNVQKHSNATRVDMRLNLDGRKLELVIEDNGSGRALDQVPASRHGLSNMRQRADMLGGVLEMESQPGRGTRIRLNVPLPPPQ